MSRRDGHITNPPKAIGLYPLLPPLQKLSIGTPGSGDSNDPDNRIENPIENTAEVQQFGGEFKDIYQGLVLLYASQDAETRISPQSATISNATLNPNLARDGSPENMQTRRELFNSSVLLLNSFKEIKEMFTTGGNWPTAVVAAGMRAPMFAAMMCTETDTKARHINEMVDEASNYVQTAVEKGRKLWDIALNIDEAADAQNVLNNFYTKADQLLLFAKASRVVYQPRPNFFKVVDEVLGGRQNLGPINTVFINHCKIFERVMTKIATSYKGSMKHGSVISKYDELSLDFFDGNWVADSIGRFTHGEKQKNISGIRTLIGFWYADSELGDVEAEKRTSATTYNYWEEIKQLFVPHPKVAVLEDGGSNTGTVHGEYKPTDDREIQTMFDTFNRKVNAICGDYDVVFLEPVPKQELTSRVLVEYFKMLVYIAMRGNENTWWYGTSLVNLHSLVAMIDGATKWTILQVEIKNQRREEPVNDQGDVGVSRSLYVHMERMEAMINFLQKKLDSTRDGATIGDDAPPPPPSSFSPSPFPSPSSSSSTSLIQHCNNKFMLQQATTHGKCTSIKDRLANLEQTTSKLRELCSPAVHSGIVDKVKLLEEAGGMKRAMELIKTHMSKIENEGGEVETLRVSITAALRDGQDILNMTDRLTNISIIVRSHNTMWEAQMAGKAGKASNTPDLVKAHSTANYSFLCLQECVSDTIKQLEAALKTSKPTHTLLQGKACGAKTVNSVMVYDAERFTLVDPPTYTCFELNDGSMDTGRPVAIALFDDKYLMNRRVAVASIHAPHFNSNPYSLYNNLKRCVDMALKGASYNTLNHIIIAGDFNRQDWDKVLEIWPLPASYSAYHYTPPKPNLISVQKAKNLKYTINNRAYDNVLYSSRDFMYTLEKKKFEVLENLGSDHAVIEVVFRVSDTDDCKDSDDDDGRNLVSSPMVEGVEEGGGTGSRGTGSRDTGNGGGDEDDDDEDDDEEDDDDEDDDEEDDDDEDDDDEDDDEEDDDEEDDAGGGIRSTLTPVLYFGSFDPGNIRVPIDVAGIPIKVAPFPVAVNGQHVC